jgi:fluoroquinolone resistance protein
MRKAIVEDQTFKGVDFTKEPLENGEYENCTFSNCNLANAD